jgi:hypothetical protein
MKIYHSPLSYTVHHIFLKGADIQFCGNMFIILNFYPMQVLSIYTCSSGRLETSMLCIFDCCTIHYITLHLFCFIIYGIYIQSDMMLSYIVYVFIVLLNWVYFYKKGCEGADCIAGVEHCMMIYLT